LWVKQAQTELELMLEMRQAEAEAQAEAAEAALEVARLEALAQAAALEAERAEASGTPSEDDASTGDDALRDGGEEDPANATGTATSPGRRASSSRTRSADMRAPVGDQAVEIDEDELSLDGLDEAADLGARGGSTPAPVIRDLDADNGEPLTAVRLVGNAEVFLIAGGERYSIPAGIPAGKYDIEAAFLGEQPAIVGQVKVRKGKEVVISCSDRLGTCRAD
jgi:hypothetical protein